MKCVFTNFCLKCMLCIEKNTKIKKIFVCLLKIIVPKTRECMSQVPVVCTKQMGTVFVCCVQDMFV